MLGKCVMPRFLSRSEDIAEPILIEHHIGLVAMVFLTEPDVGGK